MLACLPAGRLTMYCLWDFGNCCLIIMMCRGISGGDFICVSIWSFLLPLRLSLGTMLLRGFSGQVSEHFVLLINKRFCFTISICNICFECHRHHHRPQGRIPLIHNYFEQCWLNSRCSRGTFKFQLRHATKDFDIHNWVSICMPEKDVSKTIKSWSWREQEPSFHGAQQFCIFMRASH